MSYMDDVMKEAGASEETNTKPAETQQAETTPAATVETTQAATTEESPAPAGKPKPKKDLSKVSDKDKAAYSFQKQLERQRRRQETDFDAKLEKMFGEFSKKFEDFKSSQKPPEEKPKTRNDFENDTDYVNYMIQDGIKKALAERDAAHAKTAEEQAAEQKKLEQARQVAMRDQQTFVANIAATYQGEELEAWKQRVALASQKGLKDILDSSPVLKSFVMTSKYGPLVLDRIITDADSLRRLMGPFSSPMEMQLELLEIAREAKAARDAGHQETQQAPQHKGITPMGRPGAGGNSGAGRGDVFANDDALIKFMRQGRRR
jgi:hypothetical protein